MSPMKIALTLVVVLSALASSGCMTRTWSWEEPVALGNGDVLQVRRTETYRRSGQLGTWSGLVRAKVEFLNRDFPQWESRYGRPLAMDYLNGTPVIVGLVRMCVPKFDTAYFAMDLRNGRWETIDPFIINRNIPRNFVPEKQRKNINSAEKNRQLEAFLGPGGARYAKGFYPSMRDDVSCKSMFSDTK